MRQRTAQNLRMCFSRPYCVCMYVLMYEVWFLFTINTYSYIKSWVNY